MKPTLSFLTKTRNFCCFIRVMSTMGLTMLFKLIVFYINICGLVSNECTAAGIFCYLSNALSTFVYGINLVQKVVTIVSIKHGGYPPSWIFE